ncbi:DMSO/TMAO reductase YedYZ molybdopterin-dependent catalytic subunit [Actinomycetospora succinea]|uniref:DMSO/TMAO reductase YedYZ molybdopterin-dependent catalytic subunit n=1 Tax=Actinomycetospora succinea TaxID=663603 RepID=A0A4R6VMX0_9PSEU|nr:molybdopterin-dependent oxidoreductase [Actinomycetospora succinea]TDQ65159.1 DMSO/TMAO reductase YedYZ molybdopterin-dependent catalytic subunit [Actinomycetospora succinea]
MPLATDDPEPATATRLSAPPAALCGLLGVAAALAVGDLVAGLLSPASSPVLAVGGQFIRLTPEWLKAFAIATFGVYDKLALLLGIAVVLVLMAAAAGLGSRRSAAPGAVVIVVLGVVAVASATAAPVFSLVDLVAPLAALAAGLAVWFGLHRLAMRRAAAVASSDDGSAPDEEGSEDAPSSSEQPTVHRTGPVGRLGAARRRFLLGVVGAAAGAGAAAVAGRWLAAAGGADASRAAVGALPDAPGPLADLSGADFAAQGTPTWLTPNNAFYRIDTALQVPQLTTRDYALRIHGLVDRELRLSYDDLRARRLVEAPITMTCVSNEVGGSLISNAVFLGVPLADLLAEVGVRPEAQQIASTSVDGFTTGTPVAAVTDGRAAMLALAMNGEPLPVEHGFPVRMVVPGLYGFVSGCKWLTDMELTTFGEFTSYWEQRGWAEQAPVKTQSRIDVPRAGGTVLAGRTTLAGVAWAQHTGVARVEVRADGGAWQDAELARDVSIDTWRMWRTEVDLAPGAHRLQVRATDRGGDTQVATPSLTIPDGASGWHTVDVTAI